MSWYDDPRPNRPGQVGQFDDRRVNWADALLTSMFAAGVGVAVAMVFASAAADSWNEQTTARIMRQAADRGYAIQTADGDFVWRCDLENRPK